MYTLNISVSSLQSICASPEGCMWTNNEPKYFEKLMLKDVYWQCLLKVPCIGGIQTFVEIERTYKYNNVQI